MVVDQSRHTLLIADAVNSDVAVFGVSGTTLTLEPAVGLGDVSAPSGVAIDQASELLYVSDSNGRIVRYAITGGDPATYTLDPGFTSPQAGSEPGQIGNFASVALAVDPTTHDLLVADPGNHRVDRYTQTGTFAGSFDGSNGSDGVFVGPTDIAVGSDGTVYVTDSHPDESSFLYGSPGLPDSSNLERFSPADASLGDVTGLGNPELLAFDASHGMVDVASQADTPPDILNGYQQTLHPELRGFIGSDSTGALDDLSDGTTNRAFGVAVDDGPQGNAYLSGSTGLRVFTPASVLAPGVSIDGPSGVDATSVHLSATIDAGTGSDTENTTAAFQYSTDQQTWTPAPALPLSGSGAHAVAEDLGGLEPNQKYYVRLVASRTDNPAAVTTSNTIVFTTVEGSPGVTEPFATDVDSATATLPGTVNPYGLQSTYHFEWGQSAAYGNRAPAADDIAGGGHAPMYVTATLESLQPNTTYHYRLVATSTAGTTYGPDQTLTTEPTDDAPRVYEQVTPVNKGDALIEDADYGDFLNNQDGSAYLYPVGGTIPGEPKPSNPLISSYIAERDADGWSSHTLDVPLHVKDGGVGVTTDKVLPSPDLTKVVVYSDEALAPGAVDGKSNLFMEDVASGALKTVAVLPLDVREAFVGQNGAAGQGTIIQASPDLSHFALELDASPLEDPSVSFPSGTQYGFFEFHEGHIAYLNEGPEGLPLGNYTYGFSGADDGTLVSHGSGGAILYHDGPGTPLSVSQRAGDSAEPLGSGGALISQDGSTVYFLSGPLTEGAPANSGNGLYRYVVEAPPAERLSFIGQVWNEYGPGLFSVSADGSTVVYLDEATHELMAYRHLPHQNPETQVLTAPIASNSVNSVRISSDGRYVALNSTQPITGDTRTAVGCNPEAPTQVLACNEIYQFDLVAHTKACVSCVSAGVPIVPTNEGFGQSNSGEVFFTTSAALVARDVNSAGDVYGYRAGHVRLISRGAPNTRAQYHGSTPNGSDVFFVTNDQLVAQDTDDAFDVYDARIDGGIAAQNAAPGLPPCAGVACHGAVAPLPLTPPAGSVAFAGAGNATAPASPPSLKVSVSQLRRIAGTTGTLQVKLPGRGVLAVSGSGLQGLRRAVTHAGTYTIRVALTPQARRALKRSRFTKRKVRLVFTPTNGKSSTVTVSLTYGAPANRKAR